MASHTLQHRPRWDENIRPPPPWAVEFFRRLAIVVRFVSAILGACIIGYVLLMGLFFLAIFISYPVVLAVLLATALISLRLLFRG